MLRWLQDFLLPSGACQGDYDRLAYEILFEDLDRNGDGVVDILELRDGLKHWSSSFGTDQEQVSHRENVALRMLERSCTDAQSSEPICRPAPSRNFQSFWSRCEISFCGVLHAE